MIYPKLDDLTQVVPSKYALVIIAAKRARQLNAYHHMLGEGVFEDVAPPLVESPVEELPDDGARGGRAGPPRVGARDRVAGTARRPARRHGRHRRLPRAELVRLLVKDGLGVQVVMTPAAERFVGATTFAGLRGAPS